MIDFTCTLDSAGRMPRTRADFLRRQCELRAGKETRFTMGDPLHGNAATRFYWGFRVRPVAKAMVDAGMTFEEIKAGGSVSYVPATDELVHAYFKRRHLGVRCVVVDGLETVLEATTTTLSVDEFSDYVLACETDPLVEKLGVYFESPGEAGFDKPFKSGRLAEAA